MPYTPSTVPDYVPEDKAEEWAAVWTSAYDTCIEDGGKKKECESSAFAQANGKVLEEERGMKGLLERLWAKVQGVFTEALDEVKERAIKEVDEWSGAAADYADTDAYCAACLIDVNAAAGNDEKKQTHCMLPIRGPGDGSDTMVDKALHAAAGGHGISQVKRPDDVPEDEWSAAVKGAANKIISGYSQMDETAPDAVYALADKEAPERAISGFDMMDQVYSQMHASEDEIVQQGWPIDLYLDGGQLQMVITSQGKLYRAAISVDEATDTVTLGEWEQIKVEHVPVESRITIQRQADGKYRIVVIADTSILNRLGEIDSMELFDNFIRRAQDTGKYPYVTFYHVNRPEEALEAFRLGQCDYLARDEMVYVVSALLDETAPLGKDVIRALESNPEIWGTSIGFNPRAAPELAEIGGVKIPVYRDGEHVELSLILETDAAALLTAIREEVCRMDQRIVKGLKALGLSDERIAEFSTLVDGAKDRVRSEGMITRTEEGEVEPEAVEPEVVVPEALPEAVVEGEAEPEAVVAAEGPEIQDTTLVLDEETLPGLAAGLLETDAFQQVLVPIVDGLRDISEKLEAAVATLTQSQQEAIEPVRSRLEKLEQTDDDKRKVWEADLPAKRTTINVSYRAPGRGDEDVSEGSKSYAEVAKATLEKLP